MRWRRFGVMTFCAAGALVPGISSAQRSTSRAASLDTVLFVCEHGTVKSLIAKLEFERSAAAAGLRMVALSRGSAADSVVPAWMRQSLARDGFDLGVWQPKRLQAEDLKTPKLVVSFDLPPRVTEGATGRRVAWDGLPSLSQNYEAGRDAVRANVQHLVDSLRAARRR